MKFDLEAGRDEQELIRLWQENLLPGRIDAAHIIHEIAGKVKKFDRTIRWRNSREYAAGGILLAFFSWELFDPASRLIAIAGIVAVGFVMTYLWLSHRQMTPLDPAANAVAYRAALIDRYNRQILLLSRAKYWYVLPLYSWMLLSIVMTVPSQNTRRRIEAGFAVTAFSVFVVWLNQGFAVSKLRQKRNQAEALFEEGKNEV